MNKVSVKEIKVGDVVKGNLKGGMFVVAEIRTEASYMRNTSTELNFFDAEGNHFFVGRANAKATRQG